MRKIKNRLFYIVLSSILTLLPLFVGLLSWNRLPNELPIHFNFSGEAYGYAEKLETIVVLPIFVLVMHLIIVFVTMPNSAQANSFINDRVYVILLFIAPLVSVFCTMMIFKEPLNLKLDLLTIIQLLFSIVYLILGNYLPKIRRNKYIGTKLPWTARSDYNWDRTNRLTGWLFFVFGILFLVNIFVRVGEGNDVLALWVSSVLGVTIIPTVYSYALSKKE